MARRMPRRIERLDDHIANEPAGRYKLFAPASGSRENAPLTSNHGPHRLDTLWGNTTNSLSRRAWHTWSHRAGSAQTNHVVVPLAHLTSAGSTGWLCVNERLFTKATRDANCQHSA